VASILLTVLVPLNPTLTRTASACSVTVPSPLAKYVYFTGKAIKHELISDVPWPRYRWTFALKKWDRRSSGKRRKVGAKIEVSVIEMRREPTTTALNGIVNSCADVEIGIATEFQQNKVYAVSAQTNEPGSELTISRLVGAIQ
jgi:hypothetical protein